MFSIISTFQMEKENLIIEDENNTKKCGKVVVVVFSMKESQNLNSNKKIR